MFHARVRYGFLTTYRNTIFLKQEPDPSDDRQWVLWYSNVITHDSSSLDVAATSDPQAYYGKVSVRECMLFLIREIEQGNHRATNSMSASRWVDSMRMAEMAFQNEDMHIDESSSSSESSDQSDPEEKETNLIEAPSDLPDPVGVEEEEDTKAVSSLSGTLPIPTNENQKT